MQNETEVKKLVQDKKIKKEIKNERKNRKYLTGWDHIVDLV